MGAAKRSQISCYPSTSATRDTPFLFCNVGWMEGYEGANSGDTIKGGGSYVRDTGYGHEVCNFSRSNDMLYGYVQPPGAQINTGRIVPGSDGCSCSGVTVIWTAARPENTGTVVVGWYRNATVFHSYQKFKEAPPSQANNGIDGYWIEAPASQAKLLPIDQRTLEVPRRVKGGMGQSNVWYADAPQSAQFLNQVAALLDGNAPHRGKRGPSTRQDQERKAKIEKAAIRECCTHFESLGYEVVSVEKDNLGWDLQAKSGKSTLRIEVKGLSGTDFSVELTPNEYLAFEQCAHDYRLAVVLNALDVPELTICRYSQEQGNWLVEGPEGGSLDIRIKQSASLKRI